MSIEKPFPVWLAEQEAEARKLRWIQRAIVAGILLALLVFVLCSCSTGKASTPLTNQQVTTTTMETAQAPLTDDDRYIGLLDEYGVYYASKAPALKMANLICDNLNTMDGDVLLAILVSSSADADYSYSVEDMKHLMMASVTVFCPEHSGDIA